MKNWAKALSVACLFELPLLSLLFMKHPSLEAGFARLLMWYHIVPLFFIGLFSYGLLHSDSGGSRHRFLWRSYCSTDLFSHSDHFVRSGIYREVEEKSAVKETQAEVGHIAE